MNLLATPPSQRFDVAWQMILSLTVLFGLSQAMIASTSTPLYGPPAFDVYDQYDAGLFTQLEDLSRLSGSGYTTLGHPAFPNYGVRIKKLTDFCDTTVASYSGYIDVEARHLFFYFFESRSEPDKDDVIFWINGGPGGSSAFGLFMELGPCRAMENGTAYHPESWNNNANIFFIDQPVGVGFSYAEHSEVVGTTEDAAKDVAAFVAIFFEHFVKFKGRPFHMAGESYGGRYLPLFAAEVYEQNSRLSAEGLTPINLKSVIIGNGLTDFYHGRASRYDIACTSVSQKPVLSIATCVRMKQVLPRCLKMMRESCIDILDAISCEAAGSFCDNELADPVVKAGINPYDISKKCEGDFEETFCYPITKFITTYLSRPDIQAKLGVDPSVRGNFSLESDNVYQAFTANMDSYQPTQYYVAALLERGVKVLIYAGINDFRCSHVGNEAWTRCLEWSGHAAFASTPLIEWFVHGKVAGMVRSANGLTFATVEGAGHMVPYDKPAESLELINRWIYGQSLIPA